MRHFHLQCRRDLPVYHFSLANLTNKYFTNSLWLAKFEIVLTKSAATDMITKNSQQLKRRKRQQTKNTINTRMPIIISIYLSLSKFCWIGFFSCWHFFFRIWLFYFFFWASLQNKGNEWTFKQSNIQCKST